MTSRVEISKRLVLINTASGLLARVINVSVVLWLNAYLLRRISPDEYILLPVLMSIIVLLPLFTSFLTAGLGRFILAAYAQRNDCGVTQIVSTMFPLLSAAGGILLAGGLVFAWYIDKILPIPSDLLWDARMMMVLLILSVAVKPPCAVFNVGFYVQQRYVALNVINVCGELLRVLLLFVLLFAVSTRVLWVVVANVVSEVTLTVTMLVWSMRMIPALRFRMREIRWTRARELLSFGGWSFLGYLAFKLRETSVLLILQRLATPLDVVVFNVGCQGRRQVDAWTDVIAGPLYPVVTAMHAVGAKERVQNIYLRGGRFALWFTLIVGLPAALYAEPIVRLYATATYLEAAVVMIVTLAGLPISGGAWMIWQVSSATGRVRATTIYVVATQAAVVALVCFAVRTLGWGAVGVAWAMLVATAIPEVLVAWPLGLKLAGATFKAWVRETLIPGLAPGMVASVVWSGLGLIVQPENWTALGLCTAAGMLVYLIMLLAFCLEPKDREDLAVVLAKFTHLTRRYFGGPPQNPSPAIACPEPTPPQVPTGSPHD